MDILISEEFEQAFKGLSQSMRDNVRRKIQLLAENPAYPSLNTHRLNQIKSKNISDCYISDSMRLLFEAKEDDLYLWDLGSHGIVDKVHLRGFASNRHFYHTSELMPESLAIEAIDSSKLISG